MTFNNSHNLIRRLKKHFPLYWLSIFMWKKNWSKNTYCCILNQIHKTSSVTNIQKEVGQCETRNTIEERTRFEHLCIFNDHLCWHVWQNLNFKSPDACNHYMHQPSTSPLINLHKEVWPHSSCNPKQEVASLLAQRPLPKS